MMAMFSPSSPVTTPCTLACCEGFGACAFGAFGGSGIGLADGLLGACACGMTGRFGRGVLRMAGMDEEEDGVM